MAVSEAPCGSAEEAVGRWVRARREAIANPTPQTFAELAEAESGLLAWWRDRQDEKAPACERRG